MNDPASSKKLIIILLALIVLSMLFSISESSILGMNKLRLRILKKKKNKRALRIAKLLEHRERLINSLLVSNDIVNILVSSILATVALGTFGEKGVGIATLIATILLLIFGEITPKTISTRCPDRIAYFLSGFVKCVVGLMTPIVAVVTFIARIALRLGGVKVDSKKKSYTEEEIRTFFDLSEESGIIEEDANRFMNQIFKFSDLEAQDIMVPRTKIHAVSVETSYSDILELSQRLGFTRFPVYRKSIDDIVGIIYLKDLLFYKDKPETFDINEVMRPPLFIIGTKKMSSVQTMLFENRQSMAIVIDEYSGTDGIVTEKDIAREIFALPGEKSLRGKVFDYDAVENKSDFTINGLVLLKSLKSSLGIELDSNINETIGGWICEKLGRIPTAGDYVAYEGWIFQAVKIQAHRIERVRIFKGRRRGNDD
ncbi:hemolysin family protein [Treponema sp. C6A8]|uniref:hemolysin family protein n=1 Tax=Treponema sp. C6A8 TaxID=1410609 RepID=UPI0004806E9E|nr:hemolysin family protein [Treponema sp. C6A8]